MANYRHGATYGSLAYDLDALAREKQLDEAGKLPQKKVRPAQPELPSHLHIYTSPYSLYRQTSEADRHFR